MGWVGMVEMEASGRSEKGNRRKSKKETKELIQEMCEGPHFEVWVQSGKSTSSTRLKCQYMWMVQKINTERDNNKNQPNNEIDNKQELYNITMLVLLLLLFFYVLFVNIMF